ncbi:rhodanese domain-containing protein CG4456-like isoform X1 [Periplaneta americana]|uniref:rhodanese domain-containing protein CG4456-like isoform X1 n=1 Tax=Periplaneta americana TaxID=6978 RepID=UPI0037E870A1
MCENVRPRICRFIWQSKRAGNMSGSVCYDDIQQFKNDVILIDVRDRYEIQESGLIPGSINIPLDSFRPIKIRSMASTPASGPAVKDLAYDDVVELKRKNEIILIDVREPSEIKETGKLPGSVHIPLGDVKNALESLSPEEFLKMYGIEKPKLDANLVFSCRSGKRSRSAMETAMSIGFLNSRHYDGGFLDWQKHHPA